MGARATSGGREGVRQRIVGATPSEDPAEEAAMAWEYPHVVDTRLKSRSRNFIVGVNHRHFIFTEIF